MISGAHLILYSTDAEADRAFFRDVLKFPSVDVGGGWLIFRLPEAELALHPAEAGGTNELYLMCDDLAATTGELERQGVGCAAAEDMGWGVRTSFALPGGSRLSLYQPRHARP